MLSLPLNGVKAKIILDFVWDTYLDLILSGTKDDDFAKYAITHIESSMPNTFKNYDSLACKANTIFTGAAHFKTFGFQLKPCLKQPNCRYTYFLSHSD